MRVLGCVALVSLAALLSASGPIQIGQLSATADVSEIERDFTQSKWGGYTVFNRLVVYDNTAEVKVILYPPTPDGADRTAALNDTLTVTTDGFAWDGLRKTGFKIIRSGGATAVKAVWWWAEQ